VSDFCWERIPFDRQWILVFSEFSEFSLVISIRTATHHLREPGLHWKFIWFRTV